MKIYKNNLTSRECYFVERHRAKGRSYGVGVLRYSTSTGKDRWVVRTDFSYKQSDIDDIFQFTIVGSIDLDKIIYNAVLDAIDGFIKHKKIRKNKNMEGKHNEKTQH